MATYLAFLRAINLGATRKFPKAAVIAATESIGARGVETYLNTGNVRLSSSLRSTAKVASTLEQAYAEASGFEVLTMVFTPAELAAIAKQAALLAAESPAVGMQYVSLLKEPVTDRLAAELNATQVPRERCVASGRAVHLLLDARDNYHRAKLSNAWVEKRLGPATNRNLNVIRTVTEKWC